MAPLSILLGGARLTPAMEAQYFYGPPLLNAQVAAMRAGRELFFTTFDRDRKVGVVYRMLGGPSSSQGVRRRPADRHSSSSPRARRWMRRGTSMSPTALKA